MSTNSLPNLRRRASRGRPTTGLRGRGGAGVGLLPKPTTKQSLQAVKRAVGLGDPSLPPALTGPGVSPLGITTGIAEAREGEQTPGKLRLLRVRVLTKLRR